ncbi:hypothetical protein JCM19233_696 [Vibrio astriarenae]|nr:hypothetical protein JCM19233_696 [Vibrio sp. C7]
MTFNGTTYEITQFSESFDNKEILLKLVNIDGDKVDVLLSIGTGNQCIIYPEKGELDTFDCSVTERTVSGDYTLIQSQTQKSNESVQLEYYTDDIEYVGSLGSTVLTVSSENKNVNITTSFAFDDFYQNVGIEAYESSLGFTTYLQLKETTEKYKGEDIWIRFDNRIGGSADDDINIYTGLMIKDNNIATVVTPKGQCSLAPQICLQQGILEYYSVQTL